MASLPKEHVVKLQAELSNAVIVRPGDKLVVGCAGYVDMATAAKIKEQFAEALPGVELVIIDRCTSLAVYHDEPQPVRKLSRTLSEGEVQSLRERGVIDDDGKSTGDKIAEYFAEHA